MTDEQKMQIASMRKKGDGYKKISKVLDLSLNTVKAYCRRNMLTDEEIVQELPCDQCGIPVVQTKGRKRKRFCCDKCRNAWWNSHLDEVKHKNFHEYSCPGCGLSFRVYGDASRKYCSHACYIKVRFGGGKND